MALFKEYKNHPNEYVSVIFNIIGALSDKRSILSWRFQKKMVSLQIILRMLLLI